MHIRDKILANLKEKEASTAGELAELTQTSRAYVNFILQMLRDEGLVFLIGKARQARYVLAAKHKNLIKAQSGIRHISMRLKNTDLGEDRIFARIERETGIFYDVAENVSGLVRYGFTEMLNNAIDHSQSTQIFVDCRRTETAIIFTVRDFGIGIFNNVREKRQLPSTLDAIQILLKGKVTTMPEQHSGQGVFFTSRAADNFVIDSGNKRLTVNNLLPDIFITDRVLLKGTKISFAISLRSNKLLSEIFRNFSTEINGISEFSKSHVRIKLFEFGKNLISRSEAKRVAVNLEHFKEVDLDFRDVATVGQAFADEIFRVWHNRHLGVKLRAINANENVMFMVQRAQGDS
jgi:anti-sigma regulatory factor (Ser/Thr protein kinase)/biotin operon repressor